MGKSFRILLYEALGRLVEQDAANRVRPSPPSRECFRIMATVVRSGKWSAEDADHRGSCAFCQKTAELLLKQWAQAAERVPAAVETLVEVRDYIALDPSARRRVDVAVVQYILDLKSPKKIVRALLQDHQVRVSREQIAEIVQRTRRNCELVFKAEGDVGLEDKLRVHFGLKSVRVVRCTGVEPIIRWAADSLRSIVWEIRRSRLAVGTPILVGVPGGPVSFNLMSTCDHLLEQEGFDGEVVVDAMVPGAFWLHMGFVRPDWPRFQFKNVWEKTNHLRDTNYGGDQTPPMVSRERFHRLLVEEPAIHESVRSVMKLDIIVTSGALWDDPHGALQLKRNYSDAEKLRRDHNIVGELLWHPLGEYEPVRMDLMPMTSLGPDGLERLPNLIDGGTRVVAVLGPCVACKAPKTPLVRSLLRQRNRLITDLVIDAQSAEEVAQELRSETGAPVARRAGV